MTVEYCIIDVDNLSYCGRAIGSNEFVFRDAGHAVQFYADSTFLRACRKCCSRAKAVMLWNSVGQESSAVRGLKGNT